MSPVDQALAQRWVQAQAPGASVYRWAWFEAAFLDCMTTCGARIGQQVAIDLPRLNGAFFEWMRIVEQSAAFTPINAVDHAHFLCGRLLTCLFKARPVHRVCQSPRLAGRGSIEQDWPEGCVLLSFACTLLQAYRIHLGADALHWDEALFHRHWQSFRENVAEDADFAGPFLDFFSGLKPDWQFSACTAWRRAMYASRSAQASESRS